jgi:hypothetical protein
MCFGSPGSYRVVVHAADQQLQADPVIVSERSDQEIKVTLDKGRFALSH